MIFAQGTSLILDEASLSVQEDFTIFEQGTGPVSPSPPTPQMKGTLNPTQMGSVGIFLSWEYVEPIVWRRCTAAGPGKKEESRRLVLILSHFKGYIKLKPATTPNFNHWGVCSQSYYTWVSCWLKKTWGLPRGEGSGVIPNQMQQGRLPSSRTTCDVETPQGMSSCVALTRHDPQFRSSSTQSPSRIGISNSKKHVGYIGYGHVGETIIDHPFGNGFYTTKQKMLMTGGWCVYEIVLPTGCVFGVQQL